MTAILSCSDVTVAFGAFKAINGLSLDFDAGKTSEIIGPNGAGKTTLINVLSGIYRPTAGSVRLEGEDITSLRPDRRTRMGIARSFQIVKIFPEMSARENLRIAAQRSAYRIQPFWKLAGRDTEIERRIEEMLTLVGLRDLADREASYLSHGKQRALELGLTLMGEPKILLLDEPLAGVGHSELGWMTELLQTIRRRHTTIIIEHNMDAVLSLADEIVVLVAGQVLARGEPSEVTADQKVREAYLGT